MSDRPERPRLRRVEAVPLAADGREAIALRDPSGLTETVLALPREAVAVLVLLDGTRTLLDVQADLLRRHGELVPRSALEDLVATLDGQLFLEGPRLEAERRRVEAAFLACPVRPAFHAGKAYAGEREALARDLERHHESSDGARSPRQSGAARVVGLVAPHIDFVRAGATYARGYQALVDGGPIDCVIAFGTAHAGLDGHPFAVTAKPFETPFGAVPVDGEVLEAIARRAPGDLFAAEGAHRSEHSIEFQAVHLAHQARRAGQRPARLVPILTSFGHECLAAGRPPWTDPAVAGVLDAVGEAMATVRRRYCVVAGADLAHVGPRFGDAAPVTAADLERVEGEDRAYLARVAAGDRKGAFAHVARDGDRRRICGLSPIDALLAVLPAAGGRLAAYGQWPDPQGAVTFASVVFETAA